MTRALASIQEITDIRPIPGADSIVCARVLGWNVVVKKDEFKVGDKIIYCEIDSLLPMVPAFDFLASRGTKKMLVEGKEVEGYRLKTVKLRGQISQGLATPLPHGFESVEVGTDVTETLGIVKYEPPMPASLDGIAKGSFPSSIPKTDEMRIQSVPQILARYRNNPFYVTEKVDGSSCTIFVDDQGELNVCSRNTNWKRESNNAFWKVAVALGLDEKKDVFGRIAIQGELVGEKIQDNKLKISGHKFLLFSAYDMVLQKYLNYRDLLDLAKEVGVETVPIVQEVYHLPETVDEIVAYATKKSLINRDVWAEGVVLRPLEEMQDEDLGRLSFKVINPEFLLKEN